ncbi:hypothetical protein HPB47_001033 [Ixodes persulcatus]|uniref:Uncharacterized protein n=1 Tax=Ixodes persulcatus TaxID=34615 RepID=A0AC60PQ52_IXOPE|nr:hypothetical protein HPB47_001033 [Ixodes persulcatus]
MNGIAGGDVREPEDCREGSLEVCKSRRESDSSSAKYSTQGARDPSAAPPSLRVCVPGRAIGTVPTYMYHGGTRKDTQSPDSRAKSLFFFRLGS